MDKAGLITIVRDLVFLTLLASETCTVNVLLPAVVGVPLMTPALLMVSPAGSVPLVTDQL